MTGQAISALSGAPRMTRLVPSSARSRTADDPSGMVAAQRLVRDLESLEASLAAAERAAASRPTRCGFSAAAATDVDSRRAELDRWEIELQERERAVERHRMRLEQVQVRLHRAKESLKRAIFRFRNEVAERTDEFEARSRQIGEMQAELVESRRELAREQMRHKDVARKMAV